jgi:hypothetical protein
MIGRSRSTETQWRTCDVVAYRSARAAPRAAGIIIKPTPTARMATRD